MRLLTRLGSGGGRGSSTTRLKKILLSLLVIGLLGTVTGKRTYAVLSGDAYNSGSNVSSGTLTFSDLVNGQLITTPGVCKTSNDTHSTRPKVTCTTIFTGSTLSYPGDVATVNVEIQNTGSLSAGALELSMPTCVNSQTTGSGTYYTANVDLCKGICDTTTLPAPGTDCTYNGVITGGLQMYVEETASNFTTPVKCYFPGPDNADPVTSGAQNATDCTSTASGAQPWITDSVQMLAGTTCWNLGSGPNADYSSGTSHSRFFKIGVRLPTNADNRLQGQTASFTLAWHLVAGTYSGNGCTAP